MEIKTKQELADFIGVEVGKKASAIFEEQDAKQAERQKDQIFAAVAQAKKQADRSKTLLAARLIRCLAAAGGGKGAAVDMARKWNDEPLAKALGAGEGSTGGYLVAPEVGEWIERLYADSVVRKLGARTIPMPAGSISLPAGDTGSTANWVGENERADDSQPSQRMVNLTAKKLRVITPVSNELLSDAGSAADEWVEGEAKIAGELAEDLAFIRGVGTEHSPKGLLYLAAAANKFDVTIAGAAATVQEIYTDLGKAVLALANNNVKMIRPGWIMSKRTEWHLRTLLNTNAMPVFKDEMEKGLLFGMPYATTTQVPNNLGTGGDESEIYLADFFSNVIGEKGMTEIKVQDGAAYYSASAGAVVSGLSRDQTVVTLTHRVDFRSLYEGKDIAVIGAVTWGA